MTNFMLVLLLVLTTLYLTTTTTANASDCFSGDTFVNTTNGAKKMSDLVIGDMIQTGVGTFEELLGWFHREPEAPTTFIQFVTTSSISTISMTPNHIIQIIKSCDQFLNDLIPVLASEVEVGDCVRAVSVLDPDYIRNVKITTIQTVNKIGVYAPYIRNDNFYATSKYNSQFIIVTPYVGKFPNRMEKFALEHLMGFVKYDEFNGIHPSIKLLMDQLTWLYSIQQNESKF
jgi:hypothetical protein